MPKVMLVEDDNNLREIYDARLVAEGYEIVSAHDGEEALALAVKERPDLIISDVMMPKISGFDMLDILRSTPETKNTKVIMMTALGQAEDRARADKLGADRYLVKSQVTLEDVIKVAHEVLGDGGAAPAAAASGSAPAETQPAASPAPAPAPEPTQADVPVVEPPAPPAPAPTAANLPVVEPPAPASAPEEPVISMPPTPASTPPEPTLAPEPTPTPAPAEPKADDKPTDTVKQAQTEASEADTAEKQIQDFVANNPAISGSTGAPAAAEPAAPASQPVSIPVTSAPSEASSQPATQDQLANPSIQNNNEPVPEPPSHKKLVLTPTDNALAPAVDINALLAKENQNAGPSGPAVATVINPTQAPSDTPPASDIAL